MTQTTMETLKAQAIELGYEVSHEGLRMMVEDEAEREREFLEEDEVDAAEKELERKLDMIADADFEDSYFIRFEKNGITLTYSAKLDGRVSRVKESTLIAVSESAARELVSEMKAWGFQGAKAIGTEVGC